jgi:hypothetical protein
MVDNNKFILKKEATNTRLFSDKIFTYVLPIGGFVSLDE